MLENFPSLLFRAAAAVEAEGRTEANETVVIGVQRSIARRIPANVN